MKEIFFYYFYISHYFFVKKIRKWETSSKRWGKAGLINEGWFQQGPHSGATIDNFHSFFWKTIEKRSFDLKNECNFFFAMILRKYTTSYM